MESSSLDYLICKACGTQYDVTRDSGKDECRICDDPRQFVPPTGQEFTTLREMQQADYKNVLEVDEYDDRVVHISTQPKFGIGQRAILIKTPEGNTLWDCLAYLDDSTINTIKQLGGLNQIIISHPHFYTTHLEWARAFDCPVYMHVEDSPWLNRQDTTGLRKLLWRETHSFDGGLTAIKAGGHFDGSLILHWQDHLFTADAVFTAEAAHNPKPPLPGVASYAFLYSIPNHIPLPPSDIITIWKAVRNYDFKHTHGVIRSQTVHGSDLKRRIFDSAQVQIRAMGYWNHPFMQLMYHDALQMD